MVHIECLPTELWLEIFSYLHPRHNIRAFSNLNRFFDQFASTKYFGVYHRLSVDGGDPSALEYCLERSQFRIIQSLDAPNKRSIGLIEFVHRHADKLIHLRKLSLYLRGRTLGQNRDVRFINALQRLPSLKTLELRSIVPRLGDYYMKNLLIALFSERLSLTHCRLLFPLLNLNFASYQWSGGSSIQYLTLHEISWSNLLVILNQTPNLVALDVEIIEYRSAPSTLILPSLRKVVLRITRMPFVLLEDIRRLAPRLNFFSVQGSFPFENDDYFREDVWRKLLNPIAFYDVSLKCWTRSENEKLLLKGLYASFLQNQWFEYKVNRLWLDARLFFRSK